MAGLRIGIVAGEASGDLLGAGLVNAMRARNPDIEVRGIAGPLMRAAGVEAIFDADELAVMGLFEVLGRLPRLLTVRRALVREMVAWQPDVFIGIDAPDFNLPVETQLKRAGLRTVHYVSPSVWAWRPGRVNTVARAADAVLCLLPFEPEYYAGTGIAAVHVGHPLAASLRDETGARAAARTRLGLASTDRVVAVLPGSRGTELDNLGAAMAGAVRQLAPKGIRFVVPAARPGLGDQFRRMCSDDVALILTDGGAHDAMRAADVVLTASGTATLETMLLGRPMVVGYRLAPLTAWFLRTFRLLHTKYFALPNLIAGREVVPELLQERATPDGFAQAVMRLLDDEAARAAQLEAFVPLRTDLGEDADGTAAAAVLALAEGRS